MNVATTVLVHISVRALLRSQMEGPVEIGKSFFDICDKEEVTQGNRSAPFGTLTVIRTTT
jgi:hypothetical protein